MNTSGIEPSGLAKAYLSPTGPVQAVRNLDLSGGKVGAMLQSGAGLRDLTVRELIAMMGSLFPTPMGRRTENVDGHFRYVRTDDGAPYEYAGTVTCLQTYGSRVPNDVVRYRDGGRGHPGPYPDRNRLRIATPRSS
jgi:hypothetical protein